MLCERIRALARLAHESHDPGYILALLLLLIRSDDQYRVHVPSAPKALRNFARDIRTYRKLGPSLCGSLTSRQLERLCQEEPDVCEIAFEPDQLKLVKTRMSTVAQLVEGIGTDGQGRVRFTILQDLINDLQAAIEQSQKP